jgi:hypothetical protein
LSSPRKRTSAVEKPEHSYDREQRVSVLDKMLASIDRMVSRGGLSSRQLKDLAGAAKEVTATRRQEDTLPYGSKSLESAYGKAGEVPSYESIASLDGRGVPRNIAANFGLLDIEIARAADDAEGEENAKDRVRKACREAGLSGDDIPFDAMIEVALGEQHEAREAPEHQGEGLS